MSRNIVLVGGIVAAAGLIAPAIAADPPPAPATSQPAEADDGAPAATSGESGQTNGSSTDQLKTGPTGSPAWLLDLERLSLDFSVEGRYDRRAVRSDAQRGFGQRYHQTNRSHAFEETVGLSSAGAITDRLRTGPAVQFEVDARWGLTQEWFSESQDNLERHESPHGDLLEYDVNATFLPQGTISGNVFATRLDSRVPRAFQPSLDRTLERYGAGLFLNHRTFPMRLTFEHTWDELTSRTDRLDDHEERGRDALSYEGTWQISERQALRLEYEYADRSERYSGLDTRFDTTRNYLTLNHTLRFGPESRSSLETLARFQDETGDLARDTAEVSTQLRLQHTDALATNYRAQFLRESFERVVTRTWRGDVGVTHQLGETLTSSLQMYGLRQDTEHSTDFAEWGGVASASFSRDNRLGRLSANLTYNHAATSSDDGLNHGVVIGEAVTLRDPLPAYLAKADVNIASVIMQDSNRTRTYLPGRDYVAVRLGRYTAIQRVRTGQIPDRQTVLVSYTYRVFSDYDITRDRIDFRIQQDFKFGLTPYYALSIQDEELDQPRYLRFGARNVNRHRIGATYRQKRWSVGVEFEDNDDGIDPYRALHCNGDVVIWQDARSQLDGKANYSWFRFGGANELQARDTDLLDLGAVYRCLLGRGLEADASVLYRYEDDSLYGITHGVDLTGAVEWRLGYFSLRFEIEYDVLDLPGSDDQSFAVWLKLKREIPLIARNRS